MTMTIPTPDHPGPGPECTLCGRCLSVCPLFAATGREELSPRAKFLLLSRLAADPQALSRKAAADLAGLCLACGRCQAACPVGMCVPEAVGRLRAAHPGWPGFVWRQWITRAGTLWPMARALARHAPAVGPFPRWGSLLAGLDPARAVTPWLVPARFDARQAGRRIAIFPGCVGEHARTDWARNAGKLLRALGMVLLDSPDFSCCGATLGHAGLPRARDCAQRTNIEAWRAAGRPALAVFCASCHHGLTHYPEHLFEPGEAAVWGEAITPLAGLLGDSAFTATARAPAGVLFHSPCHAPAGDPDAALIRRLLNLPGPKAENPCCGFGGLMQLTAPGLSGRTAEVCWQAHAPSPGAVLLTSCGGCAAQLAATAPEGVAVDHWLAAMALDA